MARRALPAAVAGLGVFLALGAGLAVVAGAPVPAAVFGAAATFHLVVAAGLARGPSPRPPSAGFSAFWS